LPYLSYSLTYNDKELNIDWPFDLIGGEENINLSDRDRVSMTLSDAIKYDFEIMPKY
jgi:dTDP-4-dehydrorhamnose 3,5-epimerase-like enzyme